MARKSTKKSEEKDKVLLAELTEIIAVVTKLEIETDVPIFKRNELLALSHWIYERKL